MHYISWPMYKQVIQKLMLLLAIGTFLYSFIGHPSWIASSSMSPTLPVGTLLWVDRLHSPKLGDIVEFTVPTALSTEHNGKYWIKRMVGKGGDTLSTEHHQLERNDNPVDEIIMAAPGQKYVVPDGTVFVMGDNRDNSIDSRSFGSLPKKRITGTVYKLFSIASSYNRSNDISVD